MYALSVSIHVRPESVGAFIEATLDNARNTRREPGNLRFDVLQREDDAGRFVLYEVYASKEDLALHHETGHYLRWRETVQAFMAEPRSGTRLLPLFYGDSEAP